MSPWPTPTPLLKKEKEYNNKYEGGIQEFVEFLDKNKLKDDLAKEQNRCADLQSQANKLKESLAAEKTSFKKNIASKEAELKKLQNDFNKQLESVMKSSSQEDPKVNALESQVKQLNSELEKLKTKNADTSKEVAAAKYAKSILFLSYFFWMGGGTPWKFSRPLENFRGVPTPSCRPHVLTPSGELPPPRPPA